MDCHISVQMEGMIEEMDTRSVHYPVSFKLEVGSLYMVFSKFNDVVVDRGQHDTVRQHNII